MNIDKIIILILLKSLNCIKNAIYIIINSTIIKSMIIKLTRRLIFFLIIIIIIIINEEINEKIIIIIKITKSLNLTILNLNSKSKF